MPIRHARYSDIPIIARVVAPSFGPDKLFQVLFPKLDEHPEDFVTFWRRSLRASWWGYSNVLMVSYDVVTSDASNLDAEEQALATTRNNQTEILTGFGAWSRVGLGWERYWGVWGWWDPRCLIQKLVQLRNNLVYFFKPCRAAARPTADDPEPLLFSNFIARTWRWMQPLTEFPTKPWRKNYWMLDALAVHPRWQGKGCGKALAQWGVMQARSDKTGDGKGLPAMVVSAEGKEPFYKKCGFEELVGFMTRDVDGIPEANPMGSRGIPGGAVMWSLTQDDENAQIQEVKSSTAALDKQ